MPKKTTPVRPKKMIHVRLVEDVHRELRIEAAKKGMTIQEWVSKIIEYKLFGKSDAKV